MKKGKRIVCLLLSCILLLLAFPTAMATDELTPEQMADKLYELGLFKGKGTLPNGKPDYALEALATRNEAATMIIRLMGREKKAENQYAGGTIQCALGGVSDWAKANVGWLYENRLINGMTATDYGGDEPIIAQQFSALLLRVLGYSDASGGDFTYNEALSFAVKQGLMSAGQRSDFEKKFDRAAMVCMCYAALYHVVKDSSLTLLDTLYRDNVFAADDWTVAGTAKKVSLNLKYTGGGKETRWYVQEATCAAPVFTDLNGDGKGELLFAARSLFCLDPATGDTLWAVNSGKDRKSKWLDTSKDPDFGRSAVPMQVSDVDGDGKPEIITVNTNFATGKTCLAVYDQNGYFEKGWPVIIDKKMYALHVSDLNGDGKQEIILGAGTANENIPAIYVYDHLGKPLKGWPKACGYGLYSDSLSSADLDGDGVKEIICLNDDQFINAFRLDGSVARITGEDYADLEWNGIPVCESYDYEMKCVQWAIKHGGYAYASGSHVLGTTREEKNCLIGTRGGIVVTDVDGNGSEELVMTAMIVDGSKLMRGDTSTYTDSICYFTMLILNKDRMRYQNKAKGYDWTQIPVDPAEVLTVEYTVIPYADSAPVVSDLNGDGEKEILYSANDGMLHCFSLNRTEQGAWPFDLNPRSQSVMTMASKPLTVDLNGDGKQEVVFTTYTQQDQKEIRGELIVLDWLGRVMGRVTIPVRYASETDLSAANGSMAQPCVADLDGDGEYEIAITTLFAGVVVYDLEF